MATLNILSRYGETVMEWNRKDKKSVEDVRAEFDALIAGGFQAFRIENPEGGEMIREFQEDAETIIMTVPMMGG